MRLGAIQREIVTYLEACGARGGYLGVGTKVEGFRGLCFEQVERATIALERRGIVRREGIRHILVSAEK